MNDICNHLPVFKVQDNYYKRNWPDKELKYRQVKTEEIIDISKNDLLTQNWETVYKENYLYNAYETFLGIFTSLYDKSFPIRQYS